MGNIFPSSWRLDPAEIFKKYNAQLSRNMHIMRHLRLQAAYNRIAGNETVS